VSECVSECMCEWVCMWSVCVFQMSGSLTHTHIYIHTLSLSHTHAHTHTHSHTHTHTNTHTPTPTPSHPGDAGGVVALQAQVVNEARVAAVNAGIIAGRGVSGGARSW